MSCAACARFLLAAFCLGLVEPGLAEAQQAAPDVTIDAPERLAVIDGALEALRDAYVFPDVAEIMATETRRRLP
jgi:hypothetical protein